MFLFDFIPVSWFTPITMILLGLGIFVSVVGHLIKFTIFPNQYGLPLRIFGALLLLIGVYLKGGLVVSQDYQNKIDIMQGKVDKAEEESKKENVKIVEKIVKETKIIKQDTDNTKKLIKQMRDRINKQGCELSPETIELYNQGMTGESK